MTTGLTVKCTSHSATTPPATPTLSAECGPTSPQICRHPHLKCTYVANENHVSKSRILTLIAPLNWDAICISCLIALLFSFFLCWIQLNSCKLDIRRFFWDWSIQKFLHVFNPSVNVIFIVGDNVPLLFLISLLSLIIFHCYLFSLWLCKGPWGFISLLVLLSLLLVQIFPLIRNYLLSNFFISSDLVHWLWL